jgi:hypothetical protein
MPPVSQRRDDPMRRRDPGHPAEQQYAHRQRDETASSDLRSAGPECVEWDDCTTMCVFGQEYGAKRQENVHVNKDSSIDECIQNVMHAFVLVQFTLPVVPCECYTCDERCKEVVRSDLARFIGFRSECLRVESLRSRGIPGIRRPVQLRRQGSYPLQSRLLAIWVVAIE